ncbi:MAG: tRNA (guanosine(37)-N1)-methyltransferase TrmD [Bacilli bacterium]
MKIDILTLFPKMFDGFKSESIIKRAVEEEKVSINTIDFRSFAKNKHKKVDDTPYGGGSGMVLMCQPIFDAVESIKDKNSKVVLLTPQGSKFNQKKAYEFAKEEHLILICGHYEGFDERIKEIADEEISIGDFVLTGGELPSMVMTDAIVRLIPGVIEESSHANDSFNHNLLDYPTYTKPRNYKGMQVPEILLSGDHALIDKWRKNEQLKVTNDKRPDLLKKKIILKKAGINKNKNRIDVDEVKNIKVTEVVENKKSRKQYALIKNDDIKVITILKCSNIKGYTLKEKSVDNKSKKIVITNPNFIKKIANKNIYKKIEILTYRLKLALEDSDDESSSRVLGEAEMLKSMVISAYSNYLGKEALNNIIKEINFLVSEFIKTKTISSFENNLGTRRK